MFGRWGIGRFSGGGLGKAICGKSEAELIMHVYFTAPLGWRVSNPESLLILLDVGGHVPVGTVDPLTVNLKGHIRKHL